MEPLLAIIGAILIVFGLFGLFAAASASITYTHLGIGTALILFAAVRRSGKLVELAGAGSGTARASGNVVLQTLTLLLIAGLIVFISQRNPVRWDWTESGLHTLSKSTTDVLERIPEDGQVEIYGFFARGGEGSAELEFEKYTYHSDRVKFAIFDPNERPEVAHAFSVQGQDGVVFVCGGSCEEPTGKVRLPALSESEITKAIRSVITERRFVLFLTGHGEASLDDQDASGLSLFKAALDAENIEASPLLLANETAVPEWATAVVIPGPNHSIFKRELEMLDAYLQDGGAIAVLSDPLVVSNLEDQVRSWGVALGDDIVLQPRLQRLGGTKLGAQFAVTAYGDHPIVNALQGQPTVFQLARSVRGTGHGGGVVKLGWSGEGSYGETDLESFAQSRTVRQRFPADNPGPRTIGVVREVPRLGEDQGKEPGRLVVIGDSDFMRNRFISEFYNADFAVNIAAWLTREEEFATIDRKLTRASTASMTLQQFANFRFLSLFVIPEAILMLGVVSWWRRRT